MNNVYEKKLFKNNILFAGTDIVSTNSENNKPVIGIVLNTGFLTTKGKLARTVLFSEENNKQSQRESYFLLFILLIVSIVASIYVMIKGL